MSNLKLFLIGGGGGGGTHNYYGGGGGGSGGKYEGEISFVCGGTYAITVGNGGGANADGGSSSAFGKSAPGGGKGASNTNSAGSTGGGGGGGSGTSGYTAGAGGNYGGGTGYYSSTTSRQTGGGGGGAGSAGSNYNGYYYGGNGGNGYTTNITGTSETYGGGGGGAGQTTGGNGGSGGGGRGASSSLASTAGTANTGGGGGGGTYGNTASSGGSGIVIISWVTSEYSSFSYTGSYTTGTNSTYTWIKCITSGNITLTETPLTTRQVKLLVVAGGGGGGAMNPTSSGGRQNAGGGGAGGLIYTREVLSAGSYSITVGNGGAAGNYSNGVNGENSTFSTLHTAIGGGGGAYGLNESSANNGGSGGGTNETSGSLPGAGTPGQGNSGGGQVYVAGGGGGAGASGAPTYGGAGFYCNIDGTDKYYAGGGGAGGTAYNGGIGGGGSGQTLAPDYISATPGTPNTGGGGAGARGASSNYYGTSGGSGVVIVRYKSSDFTHTGGNSTGTDGSETWVKFTASGTLVLTEALPPVVATSDASEIIDTGAKANGNVTSDSGNLITERGFCYGLSSNPNIDDDDNIVVSGTTGAFSGVISGLTPDTLYYFRAYAINSAGISYGDNKTFTTLVSQRPTVNTIEGKDMTKYSGMVSFEIIEDNYATSDLIGLVYDTVSHSLPSNVIPSLSGYSKNVTQNGSYPEGNEYELALSGLLPNTTYYVRALARNVDGYGYGNEIEIHTDYEAQIDYLTPAGSILDTASPFTIKGQNFRTGVTAKIDGVDCTDVVFVDEETITAVCPISLVPKVSTLLTENPDGKTATIKFSYLEYIPPTPQPASVSASFSVKGIGVLR